MYYPTLNQVKEMANQGNLIPVYREINADLETPVSAYLKIARSPYSFLLESVEGGEHIARYSFIGTEPYKVIRTGKGHIDGDVDPLSLVQQEMEKFRLVHIDGLPRFEGGAVGYLAYDSIHHFEPRVHKQKEEFLNLPEAVIMFADTLLVFDHIKHKIKVVSHMFYDGDIDTQYSKTIAKIDALIKRLSRPLKKKDVNTISPQRVNKGEFTSNMPKSHYLEMVKKSKEYIYNGDIIQVVVSQRFQRPTPASPFDLYRSLRAINPSPYMYYLHLKDFHIIGASPELLVQVEDGKVYTHPIAGTRPRGETPEEDEILKNELINDAKERAEHIMLLDLGRNDLGRVSQPGTVKVTKQMEVEKYSHVMHLVSNVVGELRQDLNVYDALRSCFPAGTVTGAPKIRAMEIISDLEPGQRGPYSGAVGYIGFSGNMDTAITIRTIVHKDGIAYVQAGGGIVADSVPDLEYKETLSKASALLRAIDETEKMLETNDPSD